MAPIKVKSGEGNEQEKGKRMAKYPRHWYRA